MIGLFPSDHVIGDEKAIARLLRARESRSRRRARTSWCWGSSDRAETGYGYIEAGGAHIRGRSARAPLYREARRRKAAEFVAAGNYFWNSGMFLWSARTLADALREHLPKTAPLLEEIAAAFGTRKFASTFRKLYPQCENISVDYAVLEPRSAKGEQAGNIFCLPADFGWNDLGSWTALHEHHTRRAVRRKRT